MLPSWTPPVVQTRSAERAPSVPLIIGSSMYLRVVAAAALVWFHNPTAPFRYSVGGPALIVFLCLTFMQSGQRQAFWPALQRRAERILLPWLAWWLIYAAAQFWMARGIPAELANFKPWTILAWPREHLWYLPFVFVNITLVQAVRIGLAPLDNKKIKLALAFLGGLALLVLVSRIGEMPWIVGLWCLCLPAVGLGVAYGFALRLDRRRRLIAFTSIAATICLAAIPAYIMGHHIVTTSYAIGSLLMLICMIPIPRQRWITWLACLTLGVYLVHPLVMLMLWKLMGASQSYWVIAPLTQRSPT
ncbi:MAG: acyltransferase family protein [Phycisphaeraceae bacterium]|nr:acyltransferase family protein [Phycisphaeraceae bacterium]